VGKIGRREISGRNVITSQEAHSHSMVAGGFPEIS
jgi:hypothetical protein